MLTDHETRREHDEHDERELPLEGLSPRERDAQMKFPALEEPAWLEDEADDEMEEPPDSPFRGMWIGIAAAAVTFVLVFAIPQWLGWYDIGPPSQAKREPAPESVIATVTAKPSGSAVVETGSPAVPAVAAPPATAPPVSLPKAPVTKETKPTPPPATSGVAKETKPAPPAVTAPPAASSRRTFTVQIAAFKNAKQAGLLADRVKRDGYPADVRRIESSAVPYVVRVGGYTSREQAESAREALARKGFKGFIL
ncbi:MAG TPA: SPOR domain-containing protein [Candidatus Udaeobacter sp.]|nr:SPOR domain-containing protein [Candidatus Udaeobacter sp.]